MLYRKTLILCFLGVLVAATAYATPIDLNDFFSDPMVTIASDGSSATIAEDLFLSPVLLSNDPGLGDPNVIIAGAGVSLVFDYDFMEDSGVNDDEFGAYVLDSTGFSAGSAYEFFIQDTSSGAVSFDLSGLTSEPFIGLQFQLSALPGDISLDSVVTISNVELIQETVPIPEPTTILLMLSGLGGMAVFGKIRLRQCRRKA